MKKFISVAMSIILAASIGTGLSASAKNGYYCEHPCKLDNVPYYAASNRHYSGPATALQTVTFFTGEKPAAPVFTQIGYAISMKTSLTTGTSIDEMMKLINSKQDKVTYTKVSTEFDSLIKSVDHSLYEHHAPAILQLSNWDIKKSGYTTEGVYLNVTGQFNQEGMHTSLIYYVNDPMYSFLNPSGTDNGIYTIDYLGIHGFLHDGPTDYAYALCVE